MTKPIKHRIGFWTLISLIPTAILILLGFIIDTATGSLNNDADIGIGGAIGAVCMVYAVFAMPTGLVLLLWGNIEFSRAYKAAQRYAELHGWHPISRTAWRNRKRDNIALSVAQAYEKRTFILTVDVGGEVVSIDEFETSLWALEFGDWIWEELLQSGAAVDKATIEEKRSEWEQSRGIMLYRPGGSMERR